MILLNFKAHSKMCIFPRKIRKNFRLHNIIKTHSGVQKCVRHGFGKTRYPTVLFSEIFECHNVTHGTQKFTYVKHTKLNRLERGHFEIFGIGQQDSVDWKYYSFAFLKWPSYCGHSRTWDFFREFSSESHRILFLSQLLGVFSVGNSGLTFFQH